MIILYFLFIPIAEATFPGGTPCALHSQCSSGKCFEYCCKPPVPLNCQYCYGGDGECGGCLFGWELKGGECVISRRDGVTCSLPNDCESNVCKERCCESDFPHCTECQMNGKCSKCKKGYYLDPDTRECLPQREIGDVCERYILSQCLTQNAMSVGKMGSV
jgi:hypothetical protein